MDNPLVSVHMITYNHEPYIAQAIEGMLMQETDFPIELVIGEDCSTDRTREIVMEYKRKHPDIIRVITSDKNVGANQNSRRTQKACRGKYIAFCEGDDYWHHPGKLQKQVDFLENHPEYGMVHSEANMRDLEKNRVTHNVYKTEGISHEDGEDVFQRIIERRYRVFTCTVCARKSLLDELLLSDPYCFAEGRFLLGDVAVWAGLAYRARVKYLDESLATYNRLPESASHSRSVEKRIRFQKSCLEMYLHLVDRYKCGKKTKELILEQDNKSLLSLAYAAGDAELARDAMNELRRTGACVKLRQYACFLGAQNRLLNCMLRPCAFVVRAASKVFHYLRISKSRR